jgi:enoyl-[acyl-carrier protein] reductase II
MVPAAHANFFTHNRICQLFGIKFPVIQAGMVWCSGWRLASAVSNAGGLGLIGAGSMYPEVFREHVQKCKAATQQPFGVNVPLLYPGVAQIMDIIVAEKVPIVFTSAGNPALWTGFLKEKGIKVVHVVSNSRFAKKAEQAGADALVGEGFEAGGHNGREETTTFCLLPQLKQATTLPVMAAGGIATGAQMLASFVLGAEGVQVGTRFAASMESSAHVHFKEKIISLQEGDTELSLKQLTPVRLIKNDFYRQVKEQELLGASAQTLQELLGKGRAKKGMFEGDLENGELEIGQISALLNSIEPASQIVDSLVNGFMEARELV